LNDKSHNYDLCAVYFNSMVAQLFLLYRMLPIAFQENHSTNDDFIVLSSSQFVQSLINILLLYSRIALKSSL